MIDTNHDRNGPGDRTSGSHPSRPSKPGREITVEKPILGFRNVWFTRHALDRMQQRRISEAEVLQVLRSPTKKGLPTAPGRERWRRNRSRKLAIDVVFERWKGKLCVVTTIAIDLV